MGELSDKRNWTVDLGLGLALGEGRLLAMVSRHVTFQ